MTLTDTDALAQVLKVADSPEQIRRVDVYRMIQQAWKPTRVEFAAWVVERRPDLAGEVAECLVEVVAENPL